MLVVIYAPQKRENNGGNAQVYSLWTFRLKSICSSSQKIPHNSEILSEKALKLINDSISWSIICKKTCPLQLTSPVHIYCHEK